MASLPLGDETHEPSELVKKHREANRAALKAEIEVSLAKQTARSPEEIAAWLEEVTRIQQQPPLTPGPFPTAEEMIREDRER